MYFGSCYDKQVAGIKLLALQRFSGIAGIAVLWTGVVIAMSRLGLGLIDTRPISHLGIDPASSALFSTSLLVSCFLFISFGFYANRKFKVNNNFISYLLIGQAGQAITAIAPYGMHSQYKLIHTIAAFTLAFSLPLLIRSFARSQSHRPYALLFVWLYRFELLSFVLGMGLFIFTKGIAPLGEALPAVGFHIWIIGVTLASLGKSHATKT